MKKIYFVIGLLVMVSLSGCYYGSLSGEGEKPKYAVVIHGGAGYITKETVNPEKEEAVKAKLKEALAEAEEVLKNDGSAVDAVEKAIHVLENSPHFNAGKGSVLTNQGKVEMDASIMRGEDQNAGAVAGVTNVKHPITAARKVMEDSKHVMFARDGAEQFAIEQGLDTVNNDYFITKERWEKYKEDHPEAREMHKFGTVGCVALDKEGNLAAGTSTGGMSDKKYGRVGDSPIIGAGTYAHNESVGVSATGHGEYFIRYAVAHDIHALVKYKNWTVERAGDHVINKKFVYYDVNGGLIIMDKFGHIHMPFNTPGMYRGYLKAGQESVVKLYRDEE